MSITLGGTLIAHKSVEYDYCLAESLHSLLDVCDEVVVVTTPQSNDGTHDILRKFQSSSKSKLRIRVEQWKPSPMGVWLSDLTNKAREWLSTDMHLSLQADEVLHEEDYPLLIRLAMSGQKYTLNRLNFWHSHRHLLPPEEKVGSTIVRLAPTSVPSMGDAQGLDHYGALGSKARIFHYGFIRDPQKLAAKGRPMLQAFFGQTDPLWDSINKDGAKALVDPRNSTAVTVDRLSSYTGTHPKLAHNWLRERGYDL